MQVDLIQENNFQTRLNILFISVLPPASAVQPSQTVPIRQTIFTTQAPVPPPVSAARRRHEACPHCWPGPRGSIKEVTAFSLHTIAQASLWQIRGTFAAGKLVKAIHTVSITPLIEYEGYQDKYLPCIRVLE